jgi:hypothetical protein
MIRISFGLRHMHLWVAGMFLLVGPIFLYTGIQQASEETRYRSEGKTAEAVILDKSIRKATRNENSRTRYEISYRFVDAHGRSLDGTGEVAVEEWENLQKGSRIKVTYLPDSDTSRTEGSGDQTSSVVAMAMGGLLTAIGAAIFFPGFSRMVNEKRLRRSGVPVEGEVIEVERTRVSMNRVRQWVIRYRYKDHMGQNREGKTGMLPPDQAQAWTRGDKGEVRFDPHQPQKSLWVGKQ